MLAEEKSSNGAEGTPDVVHHCYQTGYSRARVAKHVLKAFTGEDAAEEALVI